MHVIYGRPVNPDASVDAIVCSTEMGGGSCLVQVLVSGNLIRNGPEHPKRFLHAELDDRTPAVSAAVGSLKGAQRRGAAGADVVQRGVAVRDRLGGKGPPGRAPRRVVPEQPEQSLIATARSAAFLHRKVQIFRLLVQLLQ
jgi:hypothetical protein